MPNVRARLAATPHLSERSSDTARCNVFSKRMTLTEAKRPLVPQNTRKMLSARSAVRSVTTSESLRYP